MKPCSVSSSWSSAGKHVRLPSNVLWMVTRYTFVSSTNQITWLLNNSPYTQTQRTHDIAEGDKGGKDQLTVYALIV